MDFSLGSIVPTRQNTPIKAVIYGVEGIGKTTCASCFPKPILLRTEDGASAVDMQMFGNILTNLQQFDEALNALFGEHDFKTLVIDSLDWFEPIIWRYLCEKSKKDSIESFGYGRGYIEAEAVWRKVVAKLDTLSRRKGMNIVWCAHSSVSKFDPPDSDPYMRYGLKIHERAACVIREWADLVVFLNYRVNVRGTFDVGSKAKAVGDGDRMAYTAERPAYFAKHRRPMSDIIEIGQDKTFDALISEIFGGDKNV